MKIAITGHTEGIGKAIYQAYLNEADALAIGFSRQNEHDISDKTWYNKLLEFDVVINNAHEKNYQIDLLHFLAKNNFKGKIINMGSISSDGEKQEIRPYSTWKAALEHANAQLYNIGFNTCILKPGLIDTPRVEGRFPDKEKMHTDDIVKIIKLVIDSKFRFKQITFGE